MAWKILMAMLVIACLSVADAHRSRRGDVTGFATSPCVSARCFGKHPGGSWRHPLTAPGRSRGYMFPGN